jgi:MFS family permease
VEGVLNLSLFLAQIVALVAAGILIESYGYFKFFYVLGGIVILAGAVAGSLLQEPPLPHSDEHQKPYWSEIRDLFRTDTLRDNRKLFILLLFIMISSIGMEVAFPYLIVYLENFVGITKSQFSIIGGAVMLGSAVLALPFGLLADKWNKRNMVAAAIVISSIGGILLSLVRTIPLLALTGLLWQAFALAASIASVAWLKDLLPEQSRGRFLGIRMIFWIAIPMVVGPWIGSTLIQNYGIPTTLNGEAGYIPVPIIFQVGSLVALLSLIPLFMIKDKKVEDTLGTRPTHSAA